MEKPILIFDYDGTIHNTLGIYEPAFRRTYQKMVDKGIVKEEEVSTGQIAGWLGLNPKEMWDSFQPDLEEEYKDQASTAVGNLMEKMILEHKAVWYDGAVQALDQLKEEGYTMLILSNCKRTYRDAQWKEFLMSRWFDRFYDCESYGFIPKTEIVQIIMTDYPGKYIVIGDRKQDMACAASCHSSFLACRYGFALPGELEGADDSIDSVSQLPEAVRRLSCAKHEQL